MTESARCDEMASLNEFWWSLRHVLIHQPDRCIICEHRRNSVSNFCTIERTTDMPLILVLFSAHCTLRDLLRSTEGMLLSLWCGKHNPHLISLPNFFSHCAERMHRITAIFLLFFLGWRSSELIFLCSENELFTNQCNMIEVGHPASSQLETIAQVMWPSSFFSLLA